MATIRRHYIYVNEKRLIAININVYGQFIWQEDEKRRNRKTHAVNQANLCYLSCMWRLTNLGWDVPRQCENSRQIDYVYKLRIYITYIYKEAKSNVWGNLVGHFAIWDGSDQRLSRVDDFEGGVRQFWLYGVLTM